jgi:hypothetical protein
LGGIRAFELVEGRARGTRCFQVDTGSGLAFTVVADRGLDIADCSFKGVNLVYHTPGGIAHPAFYDPAGLEWLRSFFAGLVTTCGLTYFGAPGRDGSEELGLHGRYSAMPAVRVCDQSRWEGDEYLLELVGSVEECVPFGNKLRLTRTIRSRIGSRSIHLHDVVENFGAGASPFTMLYHVNPGYPLLSEGSEILVSSSAVEPYDAHSAAESAEMYSVREPTTGYAEVNYLHTMAADEKGRARAGLINRQMSGGLGLSLSFDVRTLPYLSEWKMLSPVDYVVGLEPVNTKIANRAELRATGRLPTLEPGEVREMDLEFSVLEGKTEIDDFVAEVERIRRGL